MISKTYNVKFVVADKLFSAEGSNILFDYICSEITADRSNETKELIIDFEGIPVVSTSFIGRFQQRTEKIKRELGVEKVKLINLKKEIKSQFLKK
jgi:hypothetical protein